MGFNLIWRMMQQYSVYIVKLLVQLVLARILEPGEFGLIAIVLSCSSIAEIIAVSGLGTALVQKMKPDETDYSTVMTFSMGLSLVIYLVLFLASPLIARIYKEPDLVTVLRAYSAVVFFQAYLALVNAYVQKNFLFKKSFIGNLIAVAIAGVISVVCAYRGFGVWALVIYGLVSPILAIVIVQAMIHWRPRFGFAYDRFRTMFAFSWKVLLSNLIGSLLENIYSLTIGKFYGTTVGGYYKQGNTYPDAVLGQTRTAFGAVMLPIYASLQNDRENLKRTIIRMTHTITSVIFPMAFGLAAIAETFVLVFLKEKWLPAVYYLRLECVFFGTLSITTSLGNGLISIGRSDISAKLEGSKLLATILCVLLFHTFDVRILCLARVGVAVLFIFISAFIAHRVIGINLLDLILSVLKPLLLSAAMGICVYLVSLAGFRPIIALILELLVGVGIYGIGFYLFMRDDLVYLKNMFMKKGE